MSLQDNFLKASADVKSLSQRPSDGDLLKLYAYFKQATDGDCQGSRPGIFDIKGRKKFDSWNEQKGLSKDAAMEKYVALVNSLKG